MIITNGNTVQQHVSYKKVNIHFLLEQTLHRLLAIYNIQNVQNIINNTIQNIATNVLQSIFLLQTAKEVSCLKVST